MIFFQRREFDNFPTNETNSIDSIRQRSEEGRANSIWNTRSSEKQTSYR